MYNLYYMYYNKCVYYIRPHVII